MCSRAARIEVEPNQILSKIKDQKTFLRAAAAAGRGPEKTYSILTSNF
jgi:hypothetical protein